MKPTTQDTGRHGHRTTLLHNPCTFLLAGLLFCDLARDANGREGLAVVIGCDDPAFLVAQAAAFQVVHALDPDPHKVAAAAGRVREAGLDERVFCETWTGAGLPHAGDLANRIVVRNGQPIAKEELLRVLAPGASALVQDGKSEQRIDKPVPGEIDGWPQYLYDGSGISMSGDLRVDDPSRVQWIGGPKWTRAHESYSSFGAMVSSGGRIFYIVDETPVSSTTLPPQFNIVARDAFNGVVLWRRPLEKWLTQHFPWKQGPYNLLRMLIATPDELIAPVAIDGELAAFDTRTGREMRRYAGATAPEDMVLADGILVVASDPTPPDYDQLTGEYDKIRLANEGFDTASGKIPRLSDGAKNLIAYRAGGAELWRIAAETVPLGLAAAGGVCAFLDGTTLRCVDLVSGKPLWESANAVQTNRFNTAVPPTFAIVDGRVYALANGTLRAFSLQDGSRLWEHAAAISDYGAPSSLNFLDGLVWSPKLAFAKDMGNFVGYDPATGEKVREFDRQGKTIFGHSRCHRTKATSRYVISGVSGVELVDVRKEAWEDNNWVRGACTYGVMPANGLIYVPPHSCACNPEEKFNGFTAFAPAAAAGGAQPAGEPLQRGPAYEALAGQPVTDPSADEWPVYRAGYWRGNLTGAILPAELAPAWKTALGGKLTPPVAAEGRVLISRKFANELVCLDAQKGTIQWRLTTGGPVDSPPVIAAGRVWFGCTDGHVYCVRLEDGQLVWKHRAAPAERRIVVHDRIESAWPVTGSVVMRGGRVFAVAGRSSFVDGGMRVVRLNAATGELEKETRITSEALYAGAEKKQVFGIGALQDVLVAGGETLYLRNLSIDPGTLELRNLQNPRHLIATAGLLDENWHHRHFLSYGQLDGKGFVGYARWHFIGNNMISGRLLAFDEESVYGFGRNFYAGQNYRQFVTGEQYTLFSAPVDQTAGPETQQMRQRRIQEEDAKGKGARNKDFSAFNAVKRNWMKAPPFDSYALIVVNRKDAQTGALYKTIVTCGPEGDTMSSLDARLGRNGGHIACFDAESGEPVGQTRNIDAVPVFDGMIAAGGCLFMAGLDGSVHSFASSGNQAQESQR